MAKTVLRIRPVEAGTHSGILQQALYGFYRLRLKPEHDGTHQVEIPTERIIEPKQFRRRNQFTIDELKSTIMSLGHQVVEMIT